MKNKKLNIGDVVVVQMDVKSFGDATNNIGLVVETCSKEAGHIKVICPGGNDRLAFEPSEVTVISKHRA